MRRRMTCLVVSVALLVSVAGPPPSSPPPAAAEVTSSAGVAAVRTTPSPTASPVRLARLECAPYLIIGLRGSGQAMDGPFGMGGTTGVYAQEATKILPADQTKLYSLPYPAGEVSMAAFSPSVEDGRWMLTIALRRLVRSCPGIHIGLIGYSQGALVINSVLEMVGSEERKAIRSVLLLADPQSAGDTSYDKHASIVGGPGSHSGAGVLIDNELPDDIQDRSTDFCITGDLICDSPEFFELAEIIVQGWFLARLHGGYADCCGDLLMPKMLAEVFAQRLVTSPTDPPSPGPMPALPADLCPSLNATRRLTSDGPSGTARPPGTPVPASAGLALAAEPAHPCAPSAVG